ncbi:MAG: ribonuclease P protein component 4 [Candidatus Aenigmatarchaeota archaeon]
MVSRKSARKPASQVRIARERVQILFRLAGREFRPHPERSHRYVQLARRIAMRYNIRLPRELKRRVCKKCHRYLVPGANCKVRTCQKIVVVVCLECGAAARYPLKPKQTYK